MGEETSTSGREYRGRTCSTEEIWNGDGCLVMEVCSIHWKKIVKKLKKKSRERLCSVILPLPIAYEMTRKKVRRLASLIHNVETVTEDKDNKKQSLRNFDFKELASATSDFSTENLIGRGGNGEVYRGKLQTGERVAVKKIIHTKKQREKKNEEMEIVEFLTEVGIGAHIQHPNVVKMIGFSVDNGFFLVLDLAPRGSLASVLHSSYKEDEKVGVVLPWDVRYKVAVGAAHGLHHLHHGCHRRIIHRDIKASNILLSQDFTPLISDFGLAKWLPHNTEEHIMYEIEGTFGYLPPEYMRDGIANQKSDVFAYGVLLLELITGRCAVSPESTSLAMWAKPLLLNRCTIGLADPRLHGLYDAAEMEVAMAVASACLDNNPMTRPTMVLVLRMLEACGTHLQKC